MLIIYPHGARETEHGSTSQCWLKKEPQKNCEWVQSAQITKFKCEVSQSQPNTTYQMLTARRLSYTDESQHIIIRLHDSHAVFYSTQVHNTT